jgi:hypothetical protein
VIELGGKLRDSPGCSGDLGDLGGQKPTNRKEVPQEKSDDAGGIEIRPLSEHQNRGLENNE